MYNDKKHTLTIGKREGEFAGMIQMRSFEVVIRSKKPCGYNYNTQPNVVINHDGTEKTVSSK
jgi:alpha-D-xyloside xylohydrolase